MNIKFLSSVIFVQDVNVSRHFYETLLNQEVEIDHGPNVAFKAGFALWQVDHAFQMIFERAPDNLERLGRQNYESYFETPDLEAVLAQLSEASVDFVHPMMEHPWGQRGFRVYDPDGHIVEIGEPMTAVIKRFLDEGLSVEVVAQRASMPIEIVEQIAKGAR